MKKIFALLLITFISVISYSQNETTINVSKEVTIDTVIEYPISKEDISYQLNGLYSLHAVKYIDAIKDKISSIHIQSAYLANNRIYFFTKNHELEKLETLLQKKDTDKNNKLITELISKLESKKFLFHQETKKLEHLKYHYISDDDNYNELISFQYIINQTMIIDDIDTIRGIKLNGSSLIQSIIYQNTLSIFKASDINPYKIVHKSFKTPKRINGNNDSTFYEMIDVNFRNFETSIKYYKREHITQNHGPFNILYFNINVTDTQSNEYGIYKKNKIIAKFKFINNGIVLYDKSDDCPINGTIFKEHESRIFWDN